MESTGLEDTFEMIRDQFPRLRRREGAALRPWLASADELIPIELVQELGDLGVFGLTIPRRVRRGGMSKTAMCVVSEELSRGYIGVGSLPTRSEIAAELILTGGTDAQKAHWLPKIASAEILPTAVFTEPNTGSDLGALRTRAAKEGDVYVVTGNKTWITHAARADVMTLMVRTDPNTTDYRGLSLLLAPKDRGTDEIPFPAKGMSGGEIEVLGYRGMKEYEIGFDGFTVPAENLLGGVEGQGFKQLMATFESARIQTAARAIGVTQGAMESGLNYALTRQQFGGPIFAFPRVHNKIAMMAAELMGVRQLTYFAAAEKDEGRRCDLEAGMGQAARRPRRLGRRRQRPADPRRQRFRARIPDQPHPVRRAHPEHLRRRRRNPGPGDRAALAGRGAELDRRNSMQSALPEGFKPHTRKSPRHRSLGANLSKGAGGPARPRPLPSTRAHQLPGSGARWNDRRLGRQRHGHIPRDRNPREGL